MPLRHSNFEGRHSEGDARLRPGGDTVVSCSMYDPDARSRRRPALPRALAIVAAASATVASLVLPGVAHAEPAPAPSPA
ncbi:APA family fibronectin-binding glycoprotein, partial [Mycolicibacterium grossiae]|uniref:APA family fibronectin-binding glycoprotein n=1 Tax=Mycolicibacterium grossiae TaxID=1552759 RepID=UPI00399D64E5